MIKEMNAKLPFSSNTHRISTEETPFLDEINQRIANGLVPSKNNKSKALSKEQETLYT